MASRATNALRNAAVMVLRGGGSVGGNELIGGITVGGDLIQFPDVTERIACTIDGRPNPQCGQWFIAVHPGPWTNRDDDDFDERHGINITVTVRLAESPTDREAAMIDLDDSLEEFCQEVIDLLHAQMDTLMAAANFTLATSEPNKNGFTEPLRFRSCSPPVYRDGNWFRANAAEDAAGLSRTISFLDARRLIRTQ